MDSPVLVGALKAACTTFVDAVALEGEGAHLTYGALWAEAAAAARRLTATGVTPGDVVLVKCSNHPTDFVGFLATWMVGAVAAPVHRTSPVDVLAAIQDKAQGRATLDLHQSAGEIEVKQTIISSASREQVLRDGAFVIFTSGSTGQPKGVVLTHQAFHGKLLQNRDLLRPSSQTTTLLVLNDTFSFGIWIALMTILEGGKVVMQSKFTPAAFLDALVSHRVSLTGVVPTMVRATFGTLEAAALERARSRLIALGQLRSVVIGGEPLGSQLSGELRGFLGPARLYDVYGLTETSTSDFVLDPADYPGQKASIGKPFVGIQFRIVDDAGCECSPGAIGELQLQTPYVMSGYLGDEEMTQGAFVEGWFRTGDLATVDPQGFVTITGRLKELIVRGGNKITPLEVEQALARCSGVAGSMVVGLRDAILGQRIHALLVPKPEAVIDIPTLRTELASGLERFKFPDFFYVGTALPTGRTGKIDRRQLQQLLESGQLHPVAEKRSTQ